MTDDCARSLDLNAPATQRDIQALWKAVHRLEDIGSPRGLDSPAPKEPAREGAAEMPADLAEIVSRVRLVLSIYVTNGDIVRSWVPGAGSVAITRDELAALCTAAESVPGLRKELSAAQNARSWVDGERDCLTQELEDARKALSTQGQRLGDVIRDRNSAREAERKAKEHLQRLCPHEHVQEADGHNAECADCGKVNPVAPVPREAPKIVGYLVRYPGEYGGVEWRFSLFDAQCLVKVNPGATLIPLTPAPASPDSKESGK